MADYIKLPSGLASAEQFLEHYGVAYEPKRLEGKRIPLMLRFRFYLEAVELEGRVTEESTPEECGSAVRWALERALRDVDAQEAPAQSSSIGSWAAGCLSTSACAACKSTCGAG
ncbi:nitrogenase-stabilizing/protective protein NifW [Gorillibacterium sp. sgz5001074]|uniref:nitrogenase-stabilizing/protective protein NifW n=1 Tax=Gorillibacterium sp. sgz5001074 TaxID=3446695 RepID=UPI003F67CE02